jgi:DNA invertase Pin-like site-specific DNA recombinase
MPKVGYVRVSTEAQNTERQLADETLDKVFEEKASAKTKDRPKLKAMLDYIREGDTVVVHDISRLARNITDLHQLVEAITAKGATLKFKKEGLTFSTASSDPMSRLLMSMLGAVYQFEREILKERQLEGIRIAQGKGKFKGRPAKIDLSKIKQRLLLGVSQRECAAQFGVSLSTVVRASKS